MCDRGTLSDNTHRMLAWFDTLKAETNFIGKSLSRWAVVNRFSFFRGDSLSIKDPYYQLIFLLPIRLMQHDRLYKLLGLLLLPTAQEKGQFTRVGLFEFPRTDYDHNASDFEDMSASTDILDDKFFISKEGSGDSTEYTISIV
jgi:hypothetical protein